MGKFFTIREYSPRPRKPQLPVLITTWLPSGLIPVDKGSLKAAISESGPVALSGPGQHPSAQVPASPEFRRS